MSTTDSVFIIITAAALSLFFVLLSTLLIYIFITYHRLVRKAEMTLNNVESASHFIKQVTKDNNLGSLIKIIKFIVKLNRNGK